MSEQDQPIAYRFVRHFDGEFINGVPQRDLTQAEMDALPPDKRRDATFPHPLYGTPLYQKVDERPEKTGKKDGDA